MRVIGVIDVRDGRAVHARAGRRDEYATIGDAAELARTYIDRHGLSELYVADLDAIAGGTPNDAAVERLCAIAPVWLDAAVSSVERARYALALGAAHVVVGLETLPSFDALRDICNDIGGQQVAFSLDLHDGRLLGIGAGHNADIVAARAADKGAGAIIVLDLARVGTGTGIDIELIAQIREAAPGVSLLAGGGVHGPEDLVALHAAGCDGVLAATAVQDGRLDGSLAPLPGSPYRETR